MKLVISGLAIGDEVIYKNAEQTCTVIVREIKHDRVLVSKPFGNCLMSIKFYNHNYDDLQNRVQAAINGNAKLSVLLDHLDGELITTEMAKNEMQEREDDGNEWGRMYSALDVFDS